ncbi:MAG: ATP-dependent helicase [Pseudomonadota bacterium]
MRLSDEQNVVIGRPLGALCVTACAGSGKTTTATHRLQQMRKLLGDRHGIVALLSFSNIAVDTFRRDYYSLARSQAGPIRKSAVEIDTVDGFLTTNVIRPHAHRTMQAPRTPFLVQGREPFLKGFTVFDGKRPHPTSDLRITLDSGKFLYEAGPTFAKVDIAEVEGRKALEKLGKVGAYTHASGRYWSIRTLKEQPFVLRALSRRYPLILVDEAQDIAKEHQEILEMLVEAGSELSLIGDPNQGIYDFSGANGQFLTTYRSRDGVTAMGLTTNFRSVGPIVNVANKLAGRTDGTDRKEVTTLHGAYFVPYKENEKGKLLETFASMLASAEVSSADAIVLCRATKSVEEWRGGEEEQGQGTLKAFVSATICRDKLHRYGDAFEFVCSGVVSLLADKHGQLLSDISRGHTDPGIKKLKRALWNFARDPVSGLPGGALIADAEWHTALLKRVKALLADLSKTLGYEAAANLGQKLANKALRSKPLVSLPDLGSGNVAPIIRVSTVHQVKGESIDAVMYVADKKQVRALLDGPATELGRIGYVAVTRARNLMVLGIPEQHVGEFEDELVECGFKKAGT